MASFPPTCIADFMRLSHRKTIREAQKGEPLFELLMGQETERSLRMSVKASPKLAHFEAFKPSFGYFAPGEEGFKSYRPLVVEPERIRYLKNGDRLICCYGAMSSSESFDLEVELFFTCPSIERIERRSIGSSTRRPAKKAKSALQRTL